MLRNFILFFLPSVVKGGVGLFLIVPLTTFYLSPEDFGVFAIVSMITGLILPLSSTGVSWVLSAHFYKANERDRHILLFNILVLDILFKIFWSILFLLVATTVLPWIVKDYKESFFFYFQLSLLGVLLDSLWTSISYALILKESAKEVAALEMIKQLAAVITAPVCLIILKLTTETLFLIPITTGLVGLVLGLWFIRKDVYPKFSKKWVLEVFQRGMPTIPVNLFEALCNSLDRYFVQRWLSLSQLGFYSHSQSYLSIFKMGSKAFTRIFVPRALQTFSDDASIESIKKSLTLWYGLLGISGIFVTLFSYDIVDVLTHGKFVAAAPLVPIWFMLTFSLTYGMPHRQYLYVHKKTKFLVYSNIIADGVFLIIIAIFVYLFGLIGAVVGVILSNFAKQIIDRVYSGRLGCTAIADKEFGQIVIFSVALYIASTFYSPELREKILLFVVLSFLVAYRYGLLAKNLYATLGFKKLHENR